MAKKKKLAKTSATAPPSGDFSSRRLTLFAAGAAALLVVVAVVGVVAVLLSSDDSPATDTAAKKAVIVDQLQLTHPGPEFISDARSLLSDAGYSVDYVSGEQVGVETYRTLASRDYDLVILRVHAGTTTEVDANTGERTDEEYVSLFTNELYDPAKYSQDQMNRLGKATYPDGSGGFFGIGPEFIKNIPGSFEGAPIIMMGCDGLRSQKTAEAFLDKGAGPFVSWSNQVSGNFTDNATEILLQNWLIDGLPLEEAVKATADEVGPDPTYAGELRILTG
jgi:hypothetical protein